MKQYNIPIWEKLVLTVDEASELFNLGRDKIYELAKEYPTQFVLKNGKKILIKRKDFESFLQQNINI